MPDSSKRVGLSNAELKFLKELKKGNVSSYKPTYIRTLKSRILRKEKRLSYEIALVAELRDKLEAL